eukprot:CAMPEP_0201281690 /NCGR_PEP_ID=MMETSP1317-20130820/3775_1 /ASSEMBLY_ACC=CAM_ASM_000770 /TAXON_ID=187299 /ORGANISM="Undescribed Undescribed, Strain Undescribed" /LENGTH=37 /DNA_ID= /DNA_START= /DNA_END= /DNA_ORIENTATION=
MEHGPVTEEDQRKRLEKALYPTGLAGRDKKEEDEMQE